MKTILRVLALGRPEVRRFARVAVLVSLGTAASLFEPWIYRAIVDDVAGVFIAPRSFLEAERAVTGFEGTFRHFEHSGKRIFRAPLRPHAKAEPERRKLKPRTTQQAVATVVLGAILLLITNLLSDLCRLRGDNLSARLANGIERRYIVRVFRHVMHLPLTFFSKRASGAVARQIDQSDNVAPVFTAAAQEVWPDFFSLIAIVGIVSALNWQLAAIALIAVPVYLAVTWRMTRQLATRLEDYYALWDEVSSRIQQAVAGIKTVATHGTAEHEVRRLDEACEHAYATYLERNRIENRYVLIQQAIITASKAVALLLGGMKALQHQLTPGDVVLFLAYLDQIYSPIEGLTGLYASLQENASSLRRSERLLHVRRAPGEGLPAFEPQGGGIEFENVTFGYVRDQPVLDGVSLRIRPGERVGLVGPSGAGKTTLADLLVGLYRPQRGEIRIDGQLVSQVSPSSLRAAVRGVAVDGMIFRMSIASNIRYGRLDASEEEVAEAARAAGLEPLLERVRDGLDTEVGERGFQLSAGERQRILLARAFLARPTVLLLDEATANLDFKSEAAVKQDLEAMARGRTTLLIAHSRSMLTDLDRVLVLRDGRIEQDGTPEGLTQVDGYFRQMMTEAGA